MRTCICCLEGISNDQEYFRITYKNNENAEAIRVGDVHYMCIGTETLNIRKALVVACL